MVDPMPDSDLLTPDVAQMATLLIELDLPEACVEGVAANLRVLAEHVRRLEAGA